MSWFSELAGKAENILNKIDQNAANVLKSEVEQSNDTNFNNAINIDKESQPSTNTSSSIKRTFSSNSLKLLRTPKKTATSTIAITSYVDNETQNGEENENFNKNDKQFLTIASNGIDEPEPQLSNKSNASNSSRRSSCSSRTEGPVTVIECPIVQNESEKNDIMSTSAISTSSAASSKSQQMSGEDRNELSALKIILTQVKSERDRFKTEVDNLTNQATHSKANEIIAELEETCNQLASENEDLTKKFNGLMQTNNEYIKTISELETTVAKHRQTEVELIEKLNWTKSESEQAVFELQQYRARAQHTLQMKDQLIEELRTNNSSINLTNENESETLFNLQEVEYSNYAKEREQLLEEIKLLKNQFEAGKQFITSLENKNRELEHELTEKVNLLNMTLKQEKMKNLQLEENCKAQIREMKAVRDEITRQQTNYSTQLHEK